MFRSPFDWIDHPYKPMADSLKISELSTKTSSLFDLTHRKAQPCGSSTMSFAYEPHPEDHRQPKKIYYENTYKMEPEAKFRPDKAMPIIEKTLTKHLEGVKYDPVHCGSIAKIISEEIKNGVKELNFKRYKIVSQVTIGEQRDQGVKVGSRFLWDASRDNFASFSLENRSIFATGTIFAVYYE